MWWKREWGGSDAVRHKRRVSFRQQSGGEMGVQLETARLKLRRESRLRGKDHRITLESGRRWHQGRAGDGGGMGRANTELPGHLPRRWED